MLLGLQFFFTFFNFTLAIRYNNHAKFMINTNAHNDPTISEDAVTKALIMGPSINTIGMRGFYLSVPIALWLFGSIWMITGSVVLITVLYKLDREA